MNDTLPYLHSDGDTYMLELHVLSDKMVQLVSIERFPNNQNGSGVEETFMSLDRFLREQIVKQINRRYIGKTVKV